MARRDHPERKHEDDARRRKAHPERFIARDQEHDRIRRARAMGCSTVTVSPEFLTALFDSQGGRCHYCRKRLDTSAAPWRSSKFKHLDHIVSHAKGGPHSPANVCWACGPCDQRKRNRERDEFIGARALFAHATISFS